MDICNKRKEDCEGLKYQMAEEKTLNCIIQSSQLSKQKKEPVNVPVSCL